MIHYVPLNRLPANFRVPENLRNRFWYDEDKQALAYEGPMFKLTFDRLREISHEYDYQRALERLFQISTPEEDSLRGHGKGLMIAAGCVLLFVVLVCGILALRG